jgi:hypothetical protein
VRSSAPALVKPGDLILVRKLDRQADGGVAISVTAALHYRLAQQARHNIYSIRVPAT